LSFGSSPSESSSLGVSNSQTPSSSVTLPPQSSQQQQSSSPTSSQGSIVPIQSIGIICGNGIVESKEQCDSTSCCTFTCTFLPANSSCQIPGQKKNACRKKNRCQLNSITQQMDCVVGKLKRVGKRCGGRFSRRKCNSLGKCV